MKSILLTTTALVAFAGAAAADAHSGVSFSGDATLGYNTNDTTGNDGFYWDAGVDVTMSAALDNGVTASATFGLNVVEDNLGEDVFSSDYVLSLSTDMASMSFGDVDPVADANWGGVSGSHLSFNDQDAHFDVVGNDAMLVGEATVAGITAALSYGVNLDTTEEALEGLQVYASSDFGLATVEVAYQEGIDSIGTEAMYGVGASASVAGADIGVAYLAMDEESSIGIDVAYPVGPVTVGGYYSMNDGADVEDAFGVSVDYADGPIAVTAFYDVDGNLESLDDTDDSTEFGVEGSYDTGLGATVYAGFISTTVGDADATSVSYVAGTYDLGGGAELLVSYGIDEDNTAGDEIGDPEYQKGLTAEVSFSF